jgi:hypothetical protein
MVLKSQSEMVDADELPAGISCRTLQLKALTTKSAIKSPQKIAKARQENRSEIFVIFMLDKRNKTI